VKATFRALTTVVAVEIDDDLTVADLARAVIIAHPACDDTPELRYELRAGSPAMMRRNGVPDHPVDHVDDLVPVFELDLYYELARRAAPGWLLHAAALARGDRAYVFAGPSGAGKTSLMLALVARGWQLITEEMVLIDHDGLVHGLARPIHTASSGSQREALPNNWQLTPYPVRNYGETTVNIIAQPPRSIRETRPLPLGALVRIAHGHHVVEELATPTPHAALPALWDCTLRRNQATVSIAASLLSRFPTRHLTSRSVVRAALLCEAELP